MHEVVAHLRRGERVPVEVLRLVRDRQLEIGSAATSRNSASREFNVSVLFQLTMKPSMPAAFACSTWVRMTLTWSLE